MSNAAYERLPLHSAPDLVSPLSFSFAVAFTTSPLGPQVQFVQFVDTPTDVFHSAQSHRPTSRHGRPRRSLLL